MAIRVALYHRTSHSCDRHVILSPQVVRLRPAPRTQTRVTTALVGACRPKGEIRTIDYLVEHNQRVKDRVSYVIRTEQAMQTLQASRASAPSTPSTPRLSKLSCGTRSIPGTCQECAAVGGTSRYVDSSLERGQLRARGMIDRRHIVSCNGVKVPLHSTGRQGEQVAGVRFRAWQPPECLPPTTRPHVPLVFDIFDTWTGRSLGGCTYNVSHPGGRSYDTQTVNALEAESRRRARFTTFGRHTPGPMQIRALPLSLEFPFTLDLRHS